MEGLQLAERRAPEDDASEMLEICVLLREGHLTTVLAFARVVQAQRLKFVTASMLQSLCDPFLAFAVVRVEV